MQPARGGFLVIAALALAACAAPIRPQVVTPPPSAPRAEFRVEAAQVQSRAVGDEAWRENERWSLALTQALQHALHGAGKQLTDGPSASIVRSRIYLAHGAAPVRTERARRRSEYVEIRLELLEPDGQHVRYSTFTKVKLQPSPFADWFGWGQSTEDIIGTALRRSAEDFVSRL